MAELFDIQWVTEHFQVCNLRPYMDKVKAASSEDLRWFRAQVATHKKHAKRNHAFRNTPGLTTHGAIVAAIDYEMLKRSPVRHKLWSLVLPMRRFLVAKFSGMELRVNPDLGAIYVVPDSQRSAWHTTHGEMGRKVWGFMREHRKAVVAAILTIITALIIKVLALD